MLPDSVETRVPKSMMSMDRTAKTVYLMRGLPGSGKSHRARRLAGADGVVLETDQYFYTQVGEDPAWYDFSEALLPAARQWNFDRFCNAITHGVSPIVVDRGNGLNSETRQYAVHAVEQGWHLKVLHRRIRTKKGHPLKWMPLVVGAGTHLGRSSLLVHRLEAYATFTGPVTSIGPGTRGSVPKLRPRSRIPFRTGASSRA